MYCLIVIYYYLKIINYIIIVNYVMIFPPVMIGRRRAVEMLFFWGVTSPQFDAVGPGWPGIRHYHSQ